MKTPLRLLTAFALIVSAPALSGCAGLIDENATLNPRVMDTPGAGVRETHYPRGSANPNPQF